MSKRLTFLCAAAGLMLWTVAARALAQAKVNPQQRFHQVLPAGNYSGVTALGDGRFALVCDKRPDGFFMLRIAIDSLNGRIRSLDNEGYRASGRDNRDQEGIAFANGHIYISGERDNEIHEYLPDGTFLKAHAVALPAKPHRNRGLESLCYDPVRHCLWTTTETPLPGDTLLRLMQLSPDGSPLGHFLYALDAPRHRKKRRNVVVEGVSELCALSDGRLLVMEREIYMPRAKVGGSVTVRLYETRPPEEATTGAVLQKRLLAKFTTRLNLFRQNFANYEGLCEAGRLADGRIVLLLVSDSQNQKDGIIRDWMRTVVL